MEPLFVWIGIFLCLSQSAMLSGLNLACFSISRLQLEIETSENNQDAIYQFFLYPVAKPTAKVLDAWLGPEGVHYLREEMLNQYILKSMRTKGSDISTFEGRGAINFLALDSRRVGEEGAIVDPSSVVSLPVVDGRLEIPQLTRAAEDGFIHRVQASGKKWVVLTDPDGVPHLLLNSDRFLRAVFSTASVDPHDYCVEPVMTNDPQATLEQALMNAKLTENDSPEKGVILVWGTEKRIITHADVLRRLFEGVLAPPLDPARA